MVGMFSASVTKPNAEIKEPDFVSMDGGRFFIGASRKYALIDGLAAMQRRGDYNLGLVPVLNDNCIFFADIDKIPDNFSLDVLTTKIATCFNGWRKDKSCKACTAEDILVFKREREDKYHLYIPAVFGLTTKQQRMIIWKSINIEYGFDIIDANATSIRIEGFRKWDKAEGRFTPYSRYLPQGAAADMLPEVRLDQVWLNPRGRGWNQPIAPPAPVPRPPAHPAQQLNDDDRYSHNHNRNPDDFKDQSASISTLSSAPSLSLLTSANPSQSTSFILSSAPSISGVPSQAAQSATAASKEASPDGAVHSSISAHTERVIQSKFPEVANLLLQYPIVKVKHTAKQATATFVCDKTELGRTCKISGGVHTTNNIYLVFNLRTGLLVQKCFSSKCRKAQGSTESKEFIVYRRRTVVTAAAGDDLPAGKDSKLAKAFVQWCPPVTMESDGKHVHWYMYNDDVGYWQHRSTSYIMKLLMNGFKDHVMKQFKEAIEKADDKTALCVQMDDIDDILSNAQRLKGVAECIKWEVSQDVPIEWNTNPDYTVFPNGVLKMNVKDPAHPRLPYSFGKTKPEEFVSDIKCMRFKFNLPPVNMDGHYIRQARAYLRDVLLKVQPDAEDRRLIIIYMALIFKAENFKKMPINIGSSGNNAKSSTFECLVYLAGSYGLIGDIKLVVKGAKDKVSIADLNMIRIVMFEEPDAAKQLDQSFLKDLIGGAKETTGRKLFSNKNKIKLHCKTVLNANIMTTVTLEEAILERLLYFIWSSKFVTDPSLVNEAKHIYRSNPKFKTEAYWQSINDGVIWLLLNHYQLYINNGYRLGVSDRQKARTRNFLLEADQFIKWFESNFKLLPDTPANKKKFVTAEEVGDEFCKLTPGQQQQIIHGKSYNPMKFVKDTVKVHTALAPYYRERFTNYRLTLTQRSLPGAKNRAGPNCQYQYMCLTRFVTRAEAESKNLNVTNLCDEPVEEYKCQVPDNYFETADNAFFDYRNPGAGDEINLAETDDDDDDDVQLTARIGQSIDFADDYAAQGLNDSNDIPMDEQQEEAAGVKDTATRPRPRGAANDGRRNRNRNMNINVNDSSAIEDSSAEIATEQEGTVMRDRGNAGKDEEKHILENTESDKGTAETDEEENAGEGDDEADEMIGSQHEIPYDLRKKARAGRKLGAGRKLIHDDLDADGKKRQSRRKRRK